MKKYKQIFLNTLAGLKELLPILVAILLLISIITHLGVLHWLSQYIENNFTGVLISNAIGSISTGNALNSYIIADSIGDIKENIPVITVFLISWVTVGIIQLPAEIYFFGRRFAVMRNIVSFMFAIVGAYLVYFLMNI